MRKILLHPLRVQVAFYEILNGHWVRNGRQIWRQAMFYINGEVSDSMVDADLYLLQICATTLPSDVFLNTVIDKFGGRRWLNWGLPLETADLQMLESCLTFLAILINERTNLDMSDIDILRFELATLLCISDKTHSKINEFMPAQLKERVDSDTSNAIFEEVAKPPDSDLKQGKYSPRNDVWASLYDPLHVLLRAGKRECFQQSIDRFTKYVNIQRQQQHEPRIPTPWPPFRCPSLVTGGHKDPRLVLRTRVFHELAFAVLHRVVHNQNLSEHVVALIVYLLEMAVITADISESEGSYSGSGGFNGWYPTDDLIENLKFVVSRDEGMDYEDGDEAMETEDDVNLTTSRKRRKTADHGDSIISLLLKLHSQLSRAPNSFDPNSELTNPSESRIGDGPFFVGNLLKRIAILDPMCKKVCQICLLYR